MLKIINLTPHKIMLLRPEAVISDRYNHCFLRREYLPEEVALLTIEPEGVPLSVVDVPFESKGEILPCSGSMSDLAFNLQLEDRMLEGADVVLVSAKCASVINAKLPSLLRPGIPVRNPLHLDLVSLDRIYGPDHLVKQDGRNIVGCCNLKKVTFPLSILDYAIALQNGRQVSLVSLLRVCQEYCSIPQRQSMAAVDNRWEYALSLANNYIVAKGYRPYPLLNDPGYGQMAM